MQETRIAPRYAKALFDLARERKILDTVVADMKLVSEVIKANRALKTMLANPMVKADKKQAIFNQIFEKHVNQVSLAFLGIIIRKNRTIYADVISESFIGLYNDQAGIRKVKLKTAATIDEEMKQKIAAAVSGGNQWKIELTDEVDDALIGGFVLSFDNQQYDASISSRLQKLAKGFGLE